MVTITLAVPTELKKKMDKYKVLNWSAVAREAFEGKIMDLEFLEHFKSESKLTEQDAVRLGRELNKKLSKRYFQE